VGVLNPKKRDDVSARVIAGETVVLDRDGGRVHQLNATASYVWERCDGRASPTEIARDLSEQYEVEPEQAESDVATLVGQFRELGLLESATQ
jgi:PqqD family protein of HPr-rel-A system